MEIVIKPRKKWKLLDFQGLWRYRELFFIFTWRDIKVRYKQTFLGITWVIFQPLMSMGIFTIFFGKIAKIPSEGLPYELFVFIGLVFWTFFSSSLTHTSNSMVDNANIIKKIYFPKEILPLSAVVTSFVDLAINFVVIIIMALYYGFTPSLYILALLPFCVLITIFTASGLGFFLASINVKYRDIRYILPYFIQILLFLTPVIYPSSVLRDSLRYLFALNPMTGVIESMRVAFKGSSSFDYPMLFISCFISVIIFIAGLYYFKRTENFFADTV